MEMPLWLRLLGRALWINLSWWSGPVQVAGISPFFALVFLFIPSDEKVLRVALPAPGPILSLEATAGQTLTVLTFVMLLFVTLLLNYRRDIQRLSGELAGFTEPRLEILFAPEPPFLNISATHDDGVAHEQSRIYSLGIVNRSLGRSLRGITAEIVHREGTQVTNDEYYTDHRSYSMQADDIGDPDHLLEPFALNPGQMRLVHIARKLSGDDLAIDFLGARVGTLPEGEYRFQVEVTANDVPQQAIIGPRFFRIAVGERHELIVEAVDPTFQPALGIPNSATANRAPTARSERDPPACTEEMVRLTG